MSSPVFVGRKYVSFGKRACSSCGHLCKHLIDVTVATAELNLCQECAYVMQTGIAEAIDRWRTDVNDVDLIVEA